MTEKERLVKYGPPQREDHWIDANWQRGLKPARIHTTLAPTLECRHAFLAEAAWR